MTTSLTLREHLSAACADRYLVERPLGSGGSAIVYCAYDQRHHRRVALKVLRPEVAARLGAERFRREIEIAGSLSHPHILPLHDSGESNGLLYYVMPQADRSLRDRLGSGTPLSALTAVRVIRDVAEALDYAHGRGVVHRDVKPENILYLADHPVVADFGIARVIGRTGDGTVTAGRGPGTPRYMSPEQASGERDIDARSDVYSLGCTAHEMLTGAPPELPANDPLAAPGRGVRSRTLLALPGRVRSVLETALALSRVDRYASAGAFADDLERAVRASRQPAPELAPAGVAYPGDRTATDPAGLVIRGSMAA